MGFSKQEYWSGLPFPFQGSSWPRDWTQVSCFAGRFFTHCYEGTREAGTHYSMNTVRKNRIFEAVSHFSNAEHLFHQTILQGGKENTKMRVKVSPLILHCCVRLKMFEIQSPSPCWVNLCSDYFVLPYSFSHLQVFCFNYLLFSKAVLHLSTSSLDSTTPLFIWLTQFYSLINLFRWIDN